MCAYIYMYMYMYMYIYIYYTYATYAHLDPGSGTVSYDNITARCAEALNKKTTTTGKQTINKQTTK